MPKLTAREQALVEMSSRGVPVPSDWLPDFSLPSTLFILKEVCDGVLQRAVVFFGEMAQAGDEVDDVAAEVMNSLSMCLVGSVHALVSMELLPQAAEDAMTEAVNG